MTFINNISNSRSDTIDQCLHKYNLKYNLRIPGFGNKNEDALNFGSYVHKIFEIGYKEKDSKSLMKIAEQERSTYKVPFHENDRLQRCVENFILWNNKLGETVSTEQLFKLPLDSKADIDFIGIIDRVVKGTEGGYLVIDYKTSKREKKKKDLMDDPQLMGYAWLIHETYGTPYEKIWCAHYYPVTGNFPNVRFSKFQIERWKKKQIEKVWRVRKKKGTDFHAQENIFCDWCEYKPACPRFNSEAVVHCRLEEQKVLAKKLREERKLEEAKNKPS
tara:strand:- start:2068 stop:2892 length:825 start_codon:yes stop_codon:yes gene_type:complete